MDAWKPGDDCSHLGKNGIGWRWGGCRKVEGMERYWGGKFQTIFIGGCERGRAQGCHPCFCPV